VKHREAIILPFVHRTFTSDDLNALLEINQLREGNFGEALESLENRFIANFSAHHSLAVYGTLAPGRSNHGQLRNLEGEWYTGYSVTGELLSTGWAAGLGYPALRWSPTGNPVPIDLFVSAELPQHWVRLDDFEGPEYLRILVPVNFGREVVAVANLYAARPFDD